jgi:DNA segregation ATPase FtsK/SpoIIIE-like protein
VVKNYIFKFERRKRTMNTIQTIETEKYEVLKEHVQSLNPGDTISVAYIQRKIRVGYDMGKRLLESLQKDGEIESYQSWVGTTVNGVRKNGHEITLYRVPSKEKVNINE